MTPWLESLKRHLDEGRACVTVTITQLKGSTPRKVGARMVVSAEGAIDTIGGGRLEQTAIERARTLLDGDHDGPLISEQSYNLASDLSQCCGGRITLQFEKHPEPDFQIDVFGAGHVAQEIARVLSRMPCRATFHDQREDWLDRLQSVVERDAGVGVICVRRLDTDVYSMIEAQSAGRFYLVMTHSHDLDFECVEAILSRGDSAYCGLIASDSKATRFRTRLRRKQFSATEVEHLTAPLGQCVATGDTPMEVAVAAVSDLLNARASRARASVGNTTSGLITAP